MVAPPPGRVLVALSGGPDSTALLLALREIGRDIAAAHFDHALRPGSEEDAAHVGRLCAELDVPLAVERRTAPLGKGSLQAAARRLRYEFLDRAAGAAGADHIATGHTADDVVEGCLMHLERGCGLAGMRGMPERRGKVVRPLLGTWRHEIEAYLAARGVEARQDPANLDVRRFARARVRHELLPALERASPGISRTIHAAARAAARLQAEAESAAAHLNGDRRQLRRQPKAVRMELYRRLFGASPALSRAHLDAMDRLATEGATGASLSLPGGRTFRVSPSRVHMGEAEGHEPATIEVTPCPGCQDESAVHLRPGLELALGRRRPGLRMRPAPGGRTRKLQDILVDAKVPRHLRDDYPLVFAEGALAWVPGVAVDVRFKPTEPGKTIHVSLSGGPNRQW